MPSAASDLTLLHNGGAGSMRRCHPVQMDARCVEPEKESDSTLPSHVLGVKPLGNLYLSDEPNAKVNCGIWRFLPDELLMFVVENMDAVSLMKLGSTCKFLFAFCHSEELWKPLFLKLSSSSIQSLKWLGSWRSTVLALPHSKAAIPDCGNVFSDVLHRPFACSRVDLSRFTQDIPKGNRIQRMGDLTYEQYADRWTETPFVLTGCVQQWPAWHRWTVDGLLKSHANVVFRAEAVDWTLERYVEYMENNRDESPLYLFDRKFVEKMGTTVGHEHGAAYWKPDCFGPDLFEVLGEERPAHRWLIVGPERSGSTFHKDPNGTSAWNAVIQGAKYWIMFPPAAQVPGVYVSKDSSEVTSPLSIAEWLLTFHEEARRHPDCMEGICGAGEMVHVPSGWWHLVLNLEKGVALTQNFVPKSPSLGLLSEVLLFLRDKADQVSGFDSHVERPFDLFVDRLRQEDGDALEKALKLADEKSGRKRKWDDVVGKDDEAKTLGGGFTFGFGGDDDADDESRAA